MKTSAIRDKGSRVVMHNGRPAIRLNGQIVPQTAYRDYILRGDWEERIREFAASGVCVFHVRLPYGQHGRGLDFHDNAFWLGPDDYPTDDSAYPFPLDRQANHILSVCPDARLGIIFDPTPPLRWTHRYPQELQRDETGRRYRWPSLASEIYRRDLARFLRHMVRICERKPWGERIAAYYGCPLGEGVMPLAIAGKMFDCSPTTERAFRRWLCERYRTDAALRRAWNEARTTRAGARVPRDAEWLAKRARGQATLGGKPVDHAALASNSLVAAKGFFHWIEPANAAREHDYGRFIRAMFCAWIRNMYGSVKAAARELGRERTVLFDVLKQPLLGWPILSSFDGIGDARDFPNILYLSGSWDVGELLDEPDIDGVWTPADYTARTIGCAYESEGLTDSLARRGKLAVVENDARCYVGEGIRDQGAFRTPAEVEAGLRRNAALVLSRGLHDYWCNVGSSYFHDAQIHQTIRRLVRMFESPRRPVHRETRDAIAFVLDDTGPRHEDLTAGYQALAVIWQRVRGLAHCGVPYRILLFSDLERTAPPPYKVWLFPNLFQLDRERLRLLRRRVLRAGNLAIFGPSTGITDGRHLGAAGASELLGVPMELAPRTTVRHVIVQHFGHPISRELPANRIYGDMLPYGPTLIPGERAVEGAGGVPLGHANVCWFLHRTGLFLKEFGRGAAGNGRRGPRGEGDYCVVWSVALPLPADLLRACARYAGCNVWCEGDDVIYASDSLVAIHSMKAGARRLRLPRAARVMDGVTGRPVGRGPVRSIRLTIAPPETRIFFLE
jgi:hypothetical protein